MNKSLIIIIGIVLVSGLLYGFYFYALNNITSKQFNGTVQSVDGNVIFARGSYVYEKDGQLVASEEAEVKIIVTDNTELMKMVTTMPTQAELAANEGKFDFEKLKKEQKPGELSDLTMNVQNQPVSVFTDIDVYGKTDFQAKRIEYAQIVYPDINMEEE